MPPSISCSACGHVFDGAVTRTCPVCGRRQGPDWRPWIGIIRVLGVVGFLLVVGAPWQVTVIAAALVAAYGLLRRGKEKWPRTRQEVEEQERNAAHPGLLRVANFGVGLSMALLLASFVGSFAMFMNAREDEQREAVGTYHESSFRVVQSYWQKGTPGSMRMGSPDHPPRAVARGVVEGHEEWMDLAPYLTFTPKDQETVVRLVPVGTVIPVYYNPELQGEYRVRLLTSVLPQEASRHWAAAVFKYGSAALLITGAALLAFMRLRKFSLGLPTAQGPSAW